MFNYITRAWNVFKTGRPSGIEPPDQFGNCPSVNSSMSMQDYMALRQRFSDEGFFRRERTSNVMGWVSGIMLAIMVALLQMIGEGHALPALAKDVLTVVVALFALFSCIRTLHDHSVGVHRNDVCRQLDRKLNIEVDDKKHKLPPSLHRLFVVMTIILAAGVLSIIQVVKTAPCAEVLPPPTSQVEQGSASSLSPPATLQRQTGPRGDVGICGLFGWLASFGGTLCGGQGTVLAALIATIGVVATLHATLKTARQSRISSTITADRLAWLREMRVMTADLQAAFWALKLLDQIKGSGGGPNVQGIDPIKEIELTSAFQKQAAIIELFLDPRHPAGADARIQEFVRKVTSYTLNGSFVAAELAMVGLISEVQSHTNSQWGQAVREAGQG